MGSEQSGLTVRGATIAVRLLAVAVAVAAIALIGVVTHGEVPVLVPATKEAAQPTPTTSLEPGTITRLRFDQTPYLMTVGEGAAFTILGPSESSEIARIDARTFRVSTRKLPGIHFALNAGGGALWVSNCEGDSFAPCRDSSLLRLDPTTLQTVAVLPMPGQIMDMELWEDALWVEVAGLRSAMVFKLDPQTNRVVAFFPVRIGMLAVGGASAWVNDLNAHAVFRYNTATGREVARIPVGPRNEPCWLAAGEMAGWVTVCLSAAGNQLSRMDPTTNRVVDRIRFGRGSPTITYADGYLWLVTTSTREPYLSVRRLDPATNTFIGQPITIPDDPNAGPSSNCEHFGFAELSWAAVGEQALWVTSCRDAEVIRVQL